MSLNTTPRTWVAGEVVTAAELNTEVRDAITGMEAVWTTYTPAWTGSTTNPTLGNGTITGRYLRAGKSISGEVILTLGSTTTVGVGGYIWSLPFTTQAAVHTAVGGGNFFDTSAGTDLTRGVVLNSTAGMQMNDASGARVGAAIPVVPAVGDILSLQFDLELA